MEDVKLLTYNRISLFFAIILIVYFLTITFSCSAAERKEENGQLVAVQMKLNINDFYSQQKFTNKIEALMEKVAERMGVESPALVVFPEDVGLMLVALEHQQTLNTVQTIEDAIKKMTMKYFLPLVWYRKF